MKKFLLILTLFLSVSFHSTAATVTWDGDAGDNDWFSPTNWDTDALPTSADDVVITSATVNLTANTQVQRVFADGSSVFTVNSGVTLIVDGFTGNDEGVEVQGSATLINDGTIAISNINGGAGADGFYNKGMTTNNGTITIDGIGQHGLYVVAGTFTNTATGIITITNVGLSKSDADNIYVDDANSGTLFGTLVNEGMITITMTSGDDGILVKDNTTFNNTGTINISKGAGATAGDEALFVEVGGVFNNNSGGVVTISSSQDNGVGAKSTGTINNNAGATINIDAIDNDQIRLEASSSFINGGMLNLTNSGDVGIYMTDASTFVNTATGVVDISTAQDNGIHIDANSNATPATFDNSGMVTVSGSNASDKDNLRIQEDGVFNNNAGATLNLPDSADEAIQIDNSAILNNAGTVSVTNPGDHGMELFGDFNNSGSLSFTAGGDVGLRLVTNAVFTNTASGVVTVAGGSNNHAIQIDANGSATPATIDNSGMITATGGGANRDGIRLQEGGVVNNNAGATFAFVDSGDESIQIDNTAIFNNSGTVDITDAGDHGMELLGTFNNMTGGLFKAMNSADDGIRGQSTGVFNNDGDIRINGSGSDDIQVGLSSFTNTANATFAPGSSPGELEIREDFDLGSSTTTFEITGTAHTTEYDRIQGTNTQGPPADPPAIFTISNANIVLDWGSYVPAVFDFFTIITGNITVTGTFASVTSTNSNIQHFVDYSDPTKVVVFVIGVLPVELTYFEGKAEEDANYLSWETATEVNNDYFEVQHSTNGRDFTTLEKVLGYGTTTEVQNYEYLHKNVTSTDNYYRLKQVDFDGEFEYSDVIYLENRMNETPSSIYPNPTYGEISYEGAAATLTFYDIHGRQVMLQTAQEGRTTINTSNLKNGMYTIEILSDANVRTFKKLIKK